MILKRWFVFAQRLEISNINSNIAFFTVHPMLDLKPKLVPTGQPDCLVRCLLMLPINLLTPDCRAAVRGNDSLSPLCLSAVCSLHAKMRRS